MSKSIQYLSEQELFALVRGTAEDFTQTEMAEHLDCNQSSVSKMLSGDSKMLSLAVRWVQMRVPVIDWQIETDKDGKPKRYYKAVQKDGK